MERSNHRRTKPSRPIRSACHAPGTRSVSAAFEKVKLDQAVMSEWNKFLDHGAKSETERLSYWGRPPLGTGEAAEQLGQSAEAAAPVAPPAGASHAGAAPAAPSDSPPRPPRLTQPATLQAASPLGAALLNFAVDPYGEDTLARLTQLSRQVQDAFSQDRVAEAIDAVAALAELEAQAPELRVKNMYGVIFARILTRAALEQAAPFLLEPRRRERAAAALRRGGDLAAELLLTLISTAHTLGERVQYAAVLRDLPRGTDRLLALMSTRSEWQLARNIAELAGEARIEAAVPYLARFLEHDDDRLYRTALVAMAKIGTAATAEPLRNVLRSGAPELRSLVASNIGGAQARPLAPTLAALADSEQNADIVREYIRALGRIGTPDAIEALERAAGRSAMFSRRNKAARAVAEEVLRSLGRG
jgi:HEAT repeat protein